MRATIVGAGPVACLVAIELRRRDFEVELYERGVDVRREQHGKGHSFNLTLTRRGLSALEDWLIEVLYANGVPMPQRVIHHVDGALSYQPYGLTPEHHLLSIPRGLLHRKLLDEAERAGARILFSQECLAADPRRASATFAVNGRGIHETTADILIGCDGANSVIRHEMSRRGARLHVSQEYISQGYVELKMPPTADGRHPLREALQDPELPPSLDHGLHVWPRGEFLLLAQPNVDQSYTTSLFMPLTSPQPDEPSFQSLTTRADVRKLFDQHFPDVLPFLPDVESDFFTNPPAALKIVKCYPYHYQRAVLIGDAAHTMVPFYGQGINCSFEDVRAFFDILDRRLGDAGNELDVPAALAEFTRSRKAPGDAISDLSAANLRDLAQRIGDDRYLARGSLERQLHARYPDEFIPLYHMVAFTKIPYHEVVVRHERDRRILDELCRRFDLETEADQLIEAYPAYRAAHWDQPASSDLELTPSQVRELLEEVTSRLVAYQDDLASGRYPASYLRNSVKVSDYPEGRRLSDELREYDIPQHGTKLDDLLGEVFDHAAPSGMIHPHPGFMAHVPSGGLIQAGVGDFIARVLNRFGGVWAASPGLAQLEQNVIRWFCTMLGYSERSFGYLTTGGSIANFMGLRCALERRPSSDHRSATVYVSTQGHFSVGKAAKLAGIPIEQVRAVRTRPDYTMDLADLRARLRQDRADGFVPTCVVATAGTTNTGAIDDLVEVAAICREEGVWMHADACFGGFFRLTERGRTMLRGIEEADSIAVDGHKSLFLPHGSSALLVREKADLKAAFEIPDAAYIPELTDHEEHADFCNYGPELTREHRGLTAWLPIKMHGIRAFEQCLDQKLDLADELADRLRRIDGIEVVPRAEPHLPTVAFGLRTDRPAERASLTDRVCELICSRGNVYLSTSTLPVEGPVIRICILHHQTNKVIIDQLVEDLVWALGEVR